jgi:antitoxin ParD1/3/4
MPTQNVNLTPALDSFVKEQITKGYFNNASEVHRAALAAMAKEEEMRLLRLETLKAEIQKGLDDFEAGRVIETNTPEELEQFMENCFQEAMQRLEIADAERVA